LQRRVQLSHVVVRPDACLVEVQIPRWLPLYAVFHRRDAPDIRALLLDFDLIEFVAPWAVRLLHLDVLEAIDWLFLHFK